MAVTDRFDKDANRFSIARKKSIRMLCIIDSVVATVADCKYPLHSRLGFVENRARNLGGARKSLVRGLIDSGRFHVVHRLKYKSRLR